MGLDLQQYTRDRADQRALARIEEDVEEGTTKVLPLIPRSVTSFYRQFMDCLHALGIQVTINTLPSEVQNPIRCDVDEVHASYDPLYVQRLWRILEQTSTVMQRYRSPFLGKSSPVQFLWGSFDLAVTLFSGRRAPERPGFGLAKRFTSYYND